MRLWWTIKNASTADKQAVWSQWGAKDTPVDLHENRPRAVGCEQKVGMLRVPVHATARAAWLVLKPAAAK